MDYSTNGIRKYLAEINKHIEHTKVPNTNTKTYLQNMLHITTFLLEHWEKVPESIRTEIRSKAYVVPKKKPSSTPIRF